MIVVDLGCCPHQGDHSVEPLLRRYDPTALYAFDPGLAPLITPPDVLKDGRITYDPRAAWTYDGEIDLAWGARTRLYDTIIPDYSVHGQWQRVQKVPCFDFAAWLTAHPEPAVVKMNIEGAEYQLLEHVLDQQADRHVTEWVIQWHDDHMPPEYAARRAAIEARVKVPVLPWGPDEIEAAA